MLYDEIICEYIGKLVVTKKCLLMILRKGRYFPIDVLETRNCQLIETNTEVFDNLFKYIASSETIYDCILYF